MVYFAMMDTVSIEVYSDEVDYLFKFASGIQINFTLWYGASSYSVNLSHPKGKLFSPGCTLIASGNSTIEVNGQTETYVEGRSLDDVYSLKFSVQELAEEETTNESETSNKVVVDKNGSGDVSFNFGSLGKINFG